MMTRSESRDLYRRICENVKGDKPEVDAYVGTFERDYGNAVYGGHLHREHPAPEGQRHVTLRRHP